jgi:hypothetical protein
MLLTRHQKPLALDWIPVFQFIIFAIVSVPPNFLWQELLESSFPSYHAAPTQDAISAASKPSIDGNDDALEKTAQAKIPLVEPKLNKANTAIKTLLDQTLGAAVNTLLFSVFMHSIQDAMVHVPRGGHGDASLWQGFWKGANLVTAPGAIDFSRVDWNLVWLRSKTEFWPLVKAGWRLWPFVSLVNFAFVKTIIGRNLVGSLAGVVWGVYVSLFAAR